MERKFTKDIYAKLQTDFQRALGPITHSDLPDFSLYTVHVVVRKSGCVEIEHRIHEKIELAAHQLVKKIIEAGGTITTLNNTAIKPCSADVLAKVIKIMATGICYDKKDLPRVKSVITELFQHQIEAVGAQIVYLNPSIETYNQDAFAWN